MQPHARHAARDWVSQVRSGFSELKVLLVDESALQARIITTELSQLGVSSVQRCASAREALSQLHVDRPNVLVSALYLPDMLGTELVQTLRKTPAFEQLPFILISSETQPHILDPVRQSGACGILPKPFSRAQLRKVLCTTLDYLDDDLGMTEGTLPFDNLRVLLVDDSTSARRFVRRVLERLGVHRFFEAPNGVEAVNILSSEMVDLVVTDYNMPEMDGRALVDYIRRQSWQNSVPVLMVTSESDQGRLAAVQDAGVSGICDKPFEPTTVRNLLMKILSN